MTSLVAQLPAGMTLAQLAIYVVIAVAVLGIAWIAVKQSGVPIPQWVWQILGIMLLAVIAILAIKFVVSVV